MIYNTGGFMEGSERKKAVEHIDEIVEQLNLKKPISQKQINSLYGFLEEEFDEQLNEIEDTVLSEYGNMNKTDKINLLAEILKKVDTDGNTRN